MPRAADYAKAFLKDWVWLSHSGRYDMVRLKEAMWLLIANHAPLGAEWMDHALKGGWGDHRECHIGGDFLLIYQVEANWINFEEIGVRFQLNPISHGQHKEPKPGGYAGELGTALH